MTKSNGIHTFHNIGICPWKNMPTSLHIYDPLHFYYSLHADPTMQHVSIKINKLLHLFTILPQKYVLVINMPLKCHIYCILQNYLMSINVGDISIHMSPMNSLALMMQPGALYTDDNDENHAEWWHHSSITQTEYITWPNHLKNVTKPGLLKTFSLSKVEGSMECNLHQT